MKTVLIFSPADVQWVEPMADHLREHGMKVVRLGSMSIMGFLLMSRQIAAVVMHELSLPMEWETAKERMSRISPETKFITIGRDEQREPCVLARLVTS